MIVAARRMAVLAALFRLIHKLADAPLDAIDDVVGRRRAGREPDRGRILKPRGLQIRGRLHVMDAGAVRAACSHQLARVVAARAADNDDHIALPGQLDRRALPLFGRQAHRVDEAHFRTWELRANQRDQAADAIDRLRGLRHDAQSRPLDNGIEVRVIEGDVAGFEIFSDAADFNVMTLADDDRVVTVADERAHSLMRGSHERAGGLDDFEAKRTRPRDRRPRRAVRRYHHRVCLHLSRIVRHRYTALVEAFEHRRVMDQVAEDRQRRRAAAVERQVDGVADAEAHAEVGGAQDPRSTLKHKAIDIRSSFKMQS
jgi:hypothetical protein